MTWLSDRTIDHLREVADWPELPGDRYEIRERLARGGMGTVYLAVDRDLGRRVALKVLSVPRLDREMRDRMVREARVLASLEHPGIVPVHDVGSMADGRVFYVMKLVDGERLDEHVRRTPTLRERLRIFERICEAVSFAHARGVIHRDLKPGNIMVGPFGEVLVMDWGLAKILGSGRSGASDTGVGAEAPVEGNTTGVTAGQAATTRLPPAVEHAETLTRRDPAAERGAGDTVPGTVLGTPGYMSPEQASGRTDLVDRRSDVYALGAILDDLVRDAADRPPRRLLAVAAKARADDPGDRYPRVADLAADVGRFLAGEPVEAYREGLFERSARFVRTYRAPILLVLAYLLVRALVLLFQET